MKTPSYNPSPLEVEFANILKGLTGEMNQSLKMRKITSAEVHLKSDNPTLQAHIIDDDGDKHVLIIQIIQRPDEE